MCPELAGISADVKSQDWAFSASLPAEWIRHQLPTQTTQFKIVGSLKPFFMHLTTFIVRVAGGNVEWYRRLRGLKCKVLFTFL